MFVKNLELRKRFCKDNNIPIKIFEEPYFSDRLALYHRYYNTQPAQIQFEEVYNGLENEQQYFEMYNKLKDDMINYLNSSPEMLYFSKEEDFSKYEITHKNLSKNSIYKPTNSGHRFVSLDMKSANFTALRHYNPNIVKNKTSYEDFVKEFTDIDYFAQSKYIRQVIFGNINPSRQITYEKFLMDSVIFELEKIISVEDIVSFMSDEIVFCVDKYSDEELNNLVNIIKEIINDFLNKGITLKLEIFELFNVPSTEGYIKKMLPVNGNTEWVFKGFNSIELPFVLRKYYNEAVKDTDLVFLYEGRLARLLEPIEIKFY